ncbi:hypothetical protein AOLI_G00183100 [Acnodon oligacanthus]
MQQVSALPGRGDSATWLLWRQTIGPAGTASTYLSRKQRADLEPVPLVQQVGPVFTVKEAEKMQQQNYERTKMSRSLHTSQDMLEREIILKVF